MNETTPETQVDIENGRVNVIEHLMIRDKTSGRILINKRPSQITAPETDKNNG